MVKNVEEKVHSLNRYAFMIHPLDVQDVTRKFKIAKFLPDNFVEGLLPYLPAIEAAKIEGPKVNHKEVEGWFVACPLTTRQMMTLPEDQVIDKIIKTGLKAQKLGAQILGLGAFTSIVGDGGIKVAQALNIPVTTGNSYTVATAVQSVFKAAKIMEVDFNRAKVVVVGATGSIGKVCTILLAREFSNLTLVAREENRLKALANQLMYETGLAVAWTTEPKSVLRQADIILTVTSSVDVIIEPEDLKPGAIVCDVSRPRDVSRRVYEERNDVLVIEGGVVEIPGEVNLNFNFGFPSKTSYACMAETMILTLEGRFESFSLGRDISLSQVEEIKKLGDKYGFKVAGFRSFERAISQEEIMRIKERASYNKNHRKSTSWAVD